MAARRRTSSFRLPPGPDRDELWRRLPWLLVFRAAVATALFALTLAFDSHADASGGVAAVLYSVAAGNYVAVLALGVAVRLRLSAVVVSGVYLGVAIVSAFAVVHATGTSESAFAFLYLLAILDGAILGGRGLALVVATVSSVAYGAQVLMQLYGVSALGTPAAATRWNLALAAIANLGAFYTVALLAGHLGDMLQRARLAVTRVEGELRRAESLQGLILQALPVGVVALDQQGRVRSANTAALSLLETPLEAILMQPLPPSLARLVPALGSACRAAVELGGRERVLSLARSPAALGGAARASDGDLELLLIEDRTELARLERRLGMKERLAAVGELAAAIAHEIRNPLAAISGSLELLFSDDAEAVSTPSLRGIVLREIDRLDRLVREFLMYARPAPVERTRVDVAALVREVCEVLRADGAVGSTRLAIEAPEELCAEIDAEQVRQVLWNVLRNALEASPPGATVALRVAERDAVVTIEVRDHGRGLAPEIRAHLFEPFRTTKPSGTGLGLAVVNRIVEGHGGSIELDDAPGGGTLVRIALPAQRAALAAPAA